MKLNLRTRLYLQPLLALCCTACEMFETHPYDTHVSGETDITQRHINEIETALKDKKTFRFAVISDTQRWYDATVDAVEAINCRNDVDFVLHAGDQADFGATQEFMWMRDILNKLDVPYLTVIGNHDCLGTGRDVYRTLYGETNFAFTAGNVRFLGLNTNALEYDYSEPIPDFDFITHEIEEVPQGVQRSVVLMHASPRSDVFNNNVNDVPVLHQAPAAAAVLHPRPYTRPVGKRPFRRRRAVLPVPLHRQAYVPFIHLQRIRI